MTVFWRQIGWRWVPIGLLWVLVGCGYGDVSSTGYDHAKALYAITNRRAVERLPVIRQQLVDAQASGTISAREAGWLKAIIEDAERGEWDAASRAVRRLMEQQVDRTGNHHR